MKGEKKKGDMVDDMTQLESSNNKCYALAFKCLYIYIYKN